MAASLASRRYSRILILGCWLVLSLLGAVRNLSQSTALSGRWKPAVNWMQSTNTWNEIVKYSTDTAEKTESLDAAEGVLLQTPDGSRPFPWRSDSLSVSPTSPHFIRWTGLGRRNSFSYFLQHYWKRNIFCETIAEYRQKHNLTTSVPNTASTNDANVIHLQVSMDCPEIFRNHDLGTGNLLTTLYGLRWAAYNQGVHLHLQCENTTVGDYQHYILPWVMGSFPPRASMTRRSDYDATANTANSMLQSKQQTQDSWSQPTSSFCSTFNKQPIGHMVPDMILELRRMALHLVGIPESLSSSTELGQRVDSWTQENMMNDNKSQRVNDDRRSLLSPTSPVVFSNVQLDDVVVHFRCGDLMSQYAHKSYGFLTFPAYTQFISPQAKSIGILTQPFHHNKQAPPGSIRSRDRTDESGPRCEKIVTAFVQYLREHFPNARSISIHNKEPLPLTYARIILANQSISAMSSFPVFAQVASFGKAFLRRPANPTGPYQWVDRPPSVTHYNPNLVLFDSNQVIPSPWVARLWSTPKIHKHLLPLFRGEYNLTRLSALTS